MNSKAKAWVKRSLLNSGALQIAARVRKPTVAVLMYHSVMEEPARHVNTLGGIVHPAAAFRSQMEEIARHCSPVTLDDVMLFVQHDKQLPARPVVITFDDGYADNVEVAAPILNQLGIPGVFYVTVNCMDTASPPWVARLRYAFASTQKPIWPGLNGTPWQLSDGPRRDQAFTAAMEHCGQLSGVTQEQFVTRVEHELESQPMPDYRRLMMSWDQARRLRQQGHTVGSHTMTHPNMAHVAADTDLRNELIESKRRLEQELSEPSIHFSYPCPVLKPHWSARTTEFCRAAGYRTAVLADSGPVVQGDDPLRLRRVPAAVDLQTWRWNLECTFCGRSM